MKSITVKPDRMTLTQRREAYLYAEKHQQRYPQVKHHVHTGAHGNYKVTNLKTIKVELA